MRTLLYSRMDSFIKKLFITFAIKFVLFLNSNVDYCTLFMILFESFRTITAESKSSDEILETKVETFSLLEIIGVETIFFIISFMMNFNYAI